MSNWCYWESEKEDCIKEVVLIEWVWWIMNNVFIKWVEDYIKEKLKRFMKCGMVFFILCFFLECSWLCEKGLFKKR